MRIIAGAYGGRRIAQPPGRSTRPTQDRVREALFSILGDIAGVRALDLFAGSGALGIEALSRGASQCVFVEQDARAAATVRANLEALDIEAAVLRRDALRFLTGWKGEGFDLVLADPPYDSAGRVARALAERLPAVLNENASIVTESSTRMPLSLPFPIARERAYGDTLIRVHRHGS